MNNENDHIGNMIFSIKHSTPLLPQLFHSIRLSTDVILLHFSLFFMKNKICRQPCMYPGGKDVECRIRTRTRRRKKNTQFIFKIFQRNNSIKFA